MLSTSRTFTLWQIEFKSIYYKALPKPIPQWFLAVETFMLHINSTIYEHTLEKINSQAYITITYHEGYPLPFGTFALKRKFSHVHFSENSTTSDWPIKNP